VVCAVCLNEEEVIQIIPEGDRTKLVLKCGHIRTDVSRSIMEKNVPIDDELSNELFRLISFETEDDRVDAIYALIEAKERFTGIEKNKFYLTPEQINFLKSKNIKLKTVK
jgi:hypothetical protein